MKKILNVLLAVALFLSLMPSVVYAAEMKTN